MRARNNIQSDKGLLRNSQYRASKNELFRDIASREQPRRATKNCNYDIYQNVFRLRGLSECWERP